MITGLNSGVNEIRVSYWIIWSAEHAQSLPDAELTEDRIENLFHIDDSNNFADCAQRLIKINRNVLARQSFAQRRARAIA
jgi:hypothetical protein